MTDVDSRFENADGDVRLDVGYQPAWRDAVVGVIRETIVVLDVAVIDAHAYRTDAPVVRVLTQHPLATTADSWRTHDLVNDRGKWRAVDDDPPEAVKYVRDDLRDRQPFQSNTGESA